MRKFSSLATIFIVTSLFINNNAFNEEYTSNNTNNYDIVNNINNVKYKTLNDIKQAYQNFVNKAQSQEKEDVNLNSNQIFNKYKDFRQEFAPIKEAIFNMTVDNSHDKLQKDELQKIFWQYDEFLNTKCMGTDYNKLLDCQESFDYFQQKLLELMHQSKEELGQIKSALIELEDIKNKDEHKKYLWEQIQQFDDKISEIEALY